MKDLLFIDVDGTLIDSESGKLDISDRTREGLRRFQENGGKFFITTGRSYGFLPQQVVDLNADGYVLCAGAFVTIDREILRNEIFPMDKVRAFYDKLKDINTLTFIECGFVTYSNKRNDSYTEEFMEKFCIRKEVIEQIDTLEGKEINKISVTYRNMDDMHLNNDIRKLGFTVLPQPQEDSVDITLPKSTKKDGIETIVEHFNHKEYRVIAIGDSYNDIEMIEYADIGVAMGNAVDKLKSVANLVTENVENDGVYMAMKKLELI